MKKAKIKITLMSDLCVGSGYSYAGVIDSDVTADSYGFPYIPARRLKGCMREAAEMISAVLKEETGSATDTAAQQDGSGRKGEEVIKELFGGRGQKEPGKLHIENAYIEGYEKFIEEAKDPKFRKKYSKEEILQQFTSVRAQTRIVSVFDKNDEKAGVGTAAENTLRFIRVVNRISPFDNTKALTFSAQVVYPKGYEKALENILKATRALGMNRNRGLGNILCELSEKTEEDDMASQVAAGTEANKEAERVEIKYTLINKEPLMISQGSDNVSETYVPGRMILGALAAKYLAGKNSGGEQRCAEDSAFRDLFLDGSKTQFLNAYITENDGKRCIPVPAYINKLKKSKKLVNYERINEAEQAGEYDVRYGNQPEKLTGKYCTIDTTSRKVELKEVERQLTYHHRHKHGDDEVQLYSHLEITEGQRFAGIIRTTAEHEKLVKELLKSGIRLGKSRNAQYGKCEVTINEGQRDNSTESTSSQNDNLLEADSFVMISLSSPAVFMTDGRETVDYKEVYEKIAEDLKIKEYIDPDLTVKKDGKAGGDKESLSEGEAADKERSGEKDSDAPRYFGIIDTKLLFGYQSVWNLRRTPVPAVSEGSVFVYHIKDNVKESVEINCDTMVGERNLEGYGEINAILMEKLPFKIEKDEAQQDNSNAAAVNANANNFDAGNIAPQTNGSAEAENTGLNIQNESLKKLTGKIDLQREIDKKIRDMRKDDVQKYLKSLSASALGRVTLMLKEALNSDDNPINQYNNFKERIESIKTVEHREKAKEFAGKCKGSLLGGSSNNAEELKKHWGEIALDALTYQKYLKKQKGED